MDCPKIEERLSEYMESSLPPQDMGQVAQHLQQCPRCSALFAEMQSVVSLCRAFPTLEMDLDLVERILLRTTGRPRRRSFREVLKQSMVRPMLTPRFAVGAALTVLFVFLLVEMVVPRVPVVLSAMSPAELFRLMDRGVQQVYGGGLKAYDKKNEWQAQAAHFKNNVVNKMRFMVERIEVPMEGKQKTEEPERPKERAPKEKTSLLLMSSDWFERNCM